MYILMQRILLNNGISLYPVEHLASLLFSEGEIPDHIKTLECSDTLMFKRKYNIDVSHDGTEEPVVPETFTEDKYEDLKPLLYAIKRDPSVSDEDHKSRLDIELDFFERSGNKQLLSLLLSMIDKFHDEDVVWGVGRGSSCASYVLYLLEVHDVNPIKYDINFTEFSKEET